MRISRGRLFILCGLFFCLQVSAAEPVDCQSIEVDYERSCGEKDYNELKTLEAGECAKLIVNADSYWNASGLMFEKGAQYEIEAMHEEYWCDASVKTDADGWSVDEEIFEACETDEEVTELSRFKKWLFVKAEKYRRYPDANWFKLIGVNAGSSELSQFPVGSNYRYQPEKSGEFCAYANDLKMFYFNNRKSLKVKITRSD